jgi:hypothetical protein
MMAQVVQDVLASTGGGNTNGNTHTHTHTHTKDTSTDMARLEAIVSLCVEILSWDFGGFDPLHEPVSSGGSFISPPITWRPFLFRVELLEVCSYVHTHIYIYVHTHTDTYVHTHTRTCVYVCVCV